jgi:hypothetical protein
MIEQKEESHLFVIDNVKQYACDILHGACISISRKCQDCDIAKFYDKCKGKEMEGMMEET